MVAYRIAQLGEFLTHRSEFFEIDDMQEYKRVRVQLHGKGIVLRDVVSGLSLRTKKQQKVHSGDFLVAEIDAKLGGFGIVPSDLDSAVVSSHYFLFEIDETKCLAQWLGYYIRSGGLTEQVSARGSTNYAAIRAHHVLNFEIPLPPLPEQQRIVARIEALAGKIEAARGLRGEAADQTTSLWTRLARSVLDALTHVKRKPIGDLIQIGGGNTPDKGIPEYWGGNVPWFSPKDMKLLRLKDSIDHLSEVAISESRAMLYPKGSVLVVVRGMILAHTVPSAVLDVPAAINQDIKALIPSPDVMPEYLSYALWANNPHLLGLVERSTHGTCKLITNALLDFQIPVPDLTEQERVVAVIARLQAQSYGLQKIQLTTRQELDALLPAVLDRAFKGEL